MSKLQNPKVKNLDKIQTAATPELKSLNCQNKKKKNFISYLSSPFFR